MEKNKTYFQQISLQMEDLLKDYKNQYPKNLGALVRNAFPYILLAVGVIVLPMMEFTNLIATGDLGMSMGLAHTVPIVVVFSIILIRRNKRELITDPNLPLKMKAIKKQMEPFMVYPDVKKYLDGYNAQIAETDKAKQKAKNKFYIIIGALCLMVIAYWSFSKAQRRANIVSRGNTTSTSNTAFTGNFTLGGYTDIIGIKNSEPLMVLSPLKTDIYDGCKVTTKTAQFAILNDQLLLKEVNISGAADTDVFRLIITDTHGLPVPKSPKFVFKATEKRNILSSRMCQERMYETDDKLSTNHFNVLKTCRYLHDNMKNLRFLVEKIN